MTPPKGDFFGLPLNPACRTAAAAWDPAKDEAAGNSAKPTESAVCSACLAVFISLGQTTRL